MSKTQSMIPIERIASRIYLIRGEKVMLDSDLAELYVVTTSALNQQVKRNADRFPEDFAFQLTAEEFQALMSQSVISNGGPASGGKSSGGPPKVGRGGRRKLPFVFTEHGVSMLSSVLRSERAAQINIAIMRAFVKLRELLLSNRELARKVQEHDQKITLLLDTVQKLLTLPEAPKKNRIGFVPVRSRPLD